jgi:hypothetical protein
MLLMIDIISSKSVRMIDIKLSIFYLILSKLLPNIGNLWYTLLELVRAYLIILTCFNA